MPSNTRWTLNPKKWFGTMSYLNKKCDKHNNALARVSTTAATARVTSTANQSRPTIKNRAKIAPAPFLNDMNRNTHTITTSTSVTQVQLPAFSVRRERTSAFLPSSIIFNRQNTFISGGHTEPSIRRNGRLEQPLAIDTTRCNYQPSSSSDESSKYVSIPENYTGNQNISGPSTLSRRCLVDYPRYSAHLTKISSSPTRMSSSPARSSSSSSLYDENYNSSSSGIYTDERQRTESKETLSTVEILSIESINDSQKSLNRVHRRPIIHHYRRPMSVFEVTEENASQQQNFLSQSNRSHSAEGLHKDSQTISLVKSRQSSAAIAKKIEKRCPVNRSPTGTLEKAGFVRIANDTYRLTVNEAAPESRIRKRSTDSFVPFTNYDDSLRPAKDEECYATLPRTTSTDHLNNNLQNDLRLIVNECIRPMVSSIGKTRFTKNHNQRYKRPHVNNDHTQLNVEYITDKLLSSVDCSTYARYKRCC